MPREVSAGAVQPLAGGVQINCAAPAPPKTAFAIDDLKTGWRRKASSERLSRSTSWSRATGRRLRIHL
jgi:hypothetical protein